MCGPGKVTFTQSADGARIALDPYSISYFYEQVAEQRTVICYSVGGEIKEIDVLERFNRVMAILYPEQEQEEEVASEVPSMSLEMD